MRLVAAARWMPYAAHLLVTLALFEPVLRGQLPFFRDIGFYYFPNYLFLGRAFEQGIWPLWNPSADAGAPFLIAYPLDLLAVFLLGAERALAAVLPLHVLLAACGVTLLARRLGQTAWGAWLAGATYSLSGYLLSTLNLFELSHGAAWGPWVAWSVLGVLERPSGRRLASTAALLAVGVSTLAAETMLQALLVPVWLLRIRPSRRGLGALAAAGALAALLSAPVLGAAHSLLAGTQRAEGFGSQVAFAWSVHPAVLLDVILPRFFGDTHTFSQLGYWGQPFFSEGYPYLLSLYMGVPSLLLAARAGRDQLRLWTLAAFGVLLSLGWYGPLGPALALFMRHFRVPVKFFFLCALALALLVGAGLDVVRRGGRRPAWPFLPGALLLAAAVTIHQRPAESSAALGAVFPALMSGTAQQVVRNAWAEAFLASGACALGCALAQRLGGLAAAAAGLMACLDLLIVNGPVNVYAARPFFALVPEVKALVSSHQGGDGSRWFSYGAAASGARYSPWVPLANRDSWLFYAERQSLFPRWQALDGLDAAFDEDPAGWAPPGASLPAAERKPERFAGHRFRLRLASVRWVLSFQQLPGELAERRGSAPIPGLETPLILHEIDALPRAYWVPRAKRVEPAQAERLVRAGGFDPREVVLLEVAPPVTAAAGPVTDAPPMVEQQHVDAHTVRVRVRSPPGFVVITNGYHADWEGRDEKGPVPLLRANGRYWAVPTGGGDRTLTMHYRPPWRLPAFLAATVGVVICFWLARSSS